MRKISESLVLMPSQNRMLESNGIISTIWFTFFKSILDIILHISVEKKFDLENNIAVAKDIEGLSFDKSGTSHVKVDYLIQRITTGAGAQELVESGTLHCFYKPISNTWVLYKVDIPTMPVVSGITFSISATGQVKYTSTNITGTPLISKIAFRTFTMASKDKLYSKVGA